MLIWLSETLKYYYLLFSPPDLLSLDDYVFNTEAYVVSLHLRLGRNPDATLSNSHPFKVPLRSHQNFWNGPDPKVDALYADPRYVQYARHGLLLVLMLDIQRQTLLRRQQCSTRSSANRSRYSSSATVGLRELPFKVNEGVRSQGTSSTMGTFSNHVA